MENISWWRIDFGEEEINGVISAIRNENLSQGEITANFETKVGEQLNTKYVTGK